MINLRDLVKSDAEKAADKVRTTGIALAILYRGTGMIFSWQGGEAIHPFVSDLGGTKDGFPLTDVEVKESLHNGVFIGELAIVSMGPSDWNDGSQEYGLIFRKAREATLAEWQSHLDGEYPWPEVEGWA